VVPSAITGRLPEKSTNAFSDPMGRLRAVGRVLLVVFVVGLGVVVLILNAIASLFSGGR
jgi:hypothetical protein